MALRRLALRGTLAILIASGMLAACGRDKGDPVDISRQFIVALWTGDSQRVQMLSCKGTTWNLTSDPTLTVDTAQLVLRIAEESSDQVDMTVSGRVMFLSAAGQTEVRDLDELGIARFVLRDENGWKVCDIR